MHGEADYGFIISLDTQGSSALPDPDRPRMRDRIYQVAERAFAKAGISDARRRRCRYDCRRTGRWAAARCGSDGRCDR
jgi:hypothetical protein